MMYIKYLNTSMNDTHLKYSIEQKIHRINERKQKYKRSTNNSHKKFICVARKLLFKLCNYRERELFEKEFEPYQNSRVYYFIILSHVKIRMDESQRQNFKKNLTTLLQAKTQTYNQQIRRTNNKNFINFRFEEIADIQFALKALLLYLDNKVEEAIEVIYKKEKGFVLKKQQYEMAIQIVSELESKLKSYPPGELFPYLNQRSIKQDSFKEKISMSRSKREEDEEWVQEMWHREHTKYLMKREKRKETASQYKSLNDKYPLLFLQKSYQISPHFYSTLFNYQDSHPQNYVSPNQIHLQYKMREMQPSNLPSHFGFMPNDAFQNQMLDYFTPQSLPKPNFVKNEQDDINYSVLSNKGDLQGKEALLPPPGTTRDTEKTGMRGEDDQ